MNIERCENCRNWQKRDSDGSCKAAERLISAIHSGPYFKAEPLGQVCPRVVTSYDFSCGLFEISPQAAALNGLDQHDLLADGWVSIATLEGSGLIPAGSKLALVDGRLEMVNSDILGGNTRVHPLTVPLTPDSLQELKSYDTSVWKLEGIAGTVLHLSPWG